MRQTTVEINLAALTHNVSVIRHFAPTSKLLAVVKGNAYGHGVEAVGQALSPVVDGFGVAFLDEALPLLSLNLKKPIVLLEGFFDSDELIFCSENQLQVVLHNMRQVELLKTTKLKKPLTVWLKVDTGMHRLGVSDKAFLVIYQLLLELPAVGNIIVMSHFSSADNQDSADTPKQISLFNRLTKELGVAKSLANSAGILCWPESHHQIIRPGIMLYGGKALQKRLPKEHGLKPVMTFKSTVIAIREISKGESVGYGGHWQAQKDSRIATLAIGYADGYPRMMHPDAHVLIQCRRCPIVGQVSMDMITVDISNLDNVTIGDEAILFGDDLPCHEVARWCNSIDYDLMTRASLRAKKIIVS